MSLEDLSDTQIEVLKAIDHVGWYGQLWFPAVFREALNLPDGPDDEEIHTALHSLIKSGHLEIWRLENENSIRVNPSTFLEFKEHSTDTDLTLRIKDGIMPDVEARWRKEWKFPP